MENTHVRLLIISVVMLLIWGSLFYLIWQKGTALATDPCKECANRLGKGVICFESFNFPNPRTIEFTPSNKSLQPVNK